MTTDGVMDEEAAELFARLPLAMDELTHRERIVAVEMLEDGVVGIDDRRLVVRPFEDQLARALLRKSRGER